MQPDNTLSLLSETFPIFAAVPGGVQKLRELILQLAVQGKLVPQDPDDEPASVLLEKIAAEKARLIKDGKIKKAKPLPPITAEEVPFEVPGGWEWVRFGEVTYNRDGERIPVSRSERQHRVGPYDYYGASGVIDKIDHYLFDKPLLLIGEDGANLINRSTPIAFIAEGKYWVNNHAHVIDGHSLGFLRFLEVFINAIDLKPYVTGTAQPKMNQAKMNSIVVPLPSAKVQAAIVSKVDQLMALCDDLEAKYTAKQAARQRLSGAALDAVLSAQNQADFDLAWQRVADNFELLLDVPESVPKLRQAVLQLAVQGKLVPQDPNDEPASVLLEKIAAEKARLIKDGKIKKDKPLPPIKAEEVPFEVPGGWEWCRVGEILSLVNGYAYKSQYFKESAGPYVLTTPGNFYETGGFRNRGNKTKFYNGPIQSGFILEPNALIVAMTEQAAGLLGSAAFVPDDGKTYLHNQRLGKLVTDEGRMSTEYIFWYFNSPYLRKKVSDTSTGMKVKHTSPDRILSVPISLPPLSEQHRIVAKVNQLMALCDELEGSLSTARDRAEKLVGAVVEKIKREPAVDE